MEGETPITLRFMNEIHDRAEAVASELKKNPASRAMGRISKASAFRLAVLRGLESLEAELGLTPTPKAVKKRGSK